MALQMTPKVKIESCKAKTGMARNHPRNTGPMCSSPRCGAKTCSRDPCKSPAVFGKKRCRMHGGAAGSGAPEKLKMLSSTVVIRGDALKNGIGRELSCGRRGN